MSEMTSEELEQKILKHLESGKVKVRAVSKSISADKKLVYQAIAKLAKEDKIEYLYLDTSYLQLKGSRGNKL